MRLLLSALLSWLVGLEAGLWLPVWLGVGLATLAGWLTRSLAVGGLLCAGVLVGTQWTANWESLSKLNGQPAVLEVRLTQAAPAVRGVVRGVPVSWRGQEALLPGDRVLVYCPEWKAQQQSTLLARARPRLTCAKPEVKGRTPAANWQQWFYRTRVQATEKIFNTLPPPVGELAIGFVLGDDSWLPLEVQEDFRTAGTTHVLALSGYNVSLLASLLMTWLPSLVGLRPASALVVGVLIGFCLLTGAPGSLVRATVMGAAVLWARAAGRGVSGQRALWLAVLGLLVVSPNLSLDIGFALSVVATAGLLVTPSLNAWLSVLVTPLSANAATLPVILGTFGRLSVISPLANILITPLVTPLFLSCLVLVICVLLFPAIITLVVPIVSWVSTLFLTIIHWCAQQPWALVELPRLPFVALLLPLAWVLVLLRQRRTCRQCDCPPVSLKSYGST